MAATEDQQIPWDAGPFMPPSDERTLDRLKQAASTCAGCDLYQTGTQTVFGEGPPSATVMFVGEQPGDQEDRAGKPFVGPAGRVLDDALDEVGIDRSQVYVTNAVKHFKWEARGRPLADTGLAPYVVATVHPASILRAPDPEARGAEGRAFIEDLRTVKHLLDR